MRQLMMVLVASMVLLVGSLDMATARDKSGVLKASELLGMKVEGTDGKKL
ncbi:MAG: hypothetical protein H0W13_09140, partial [Nitrospirales bacterium]|nr:hypothetical protein [Nitrospirales bacterium]